MGAGELLGPAAITIDPNDQSALVGAMRRLTDPVFACAMGAEAAQRAAGSTWSHVAARILDALGAGCPAVPMNTPAGAETRRGRDLALPRRTGDLP